LGRITQVPDDYDEGVINQALLRVRLNNNIFDDSFFKMLFRSPYFQKQIFKNSTGSAIPNVKGVNELKAIPLPLPIFEEQREIITNLEEYMSFVSVFDRQVDKNLKRAVRLRQLILKKAFSGKLLKTIAGKGM
jgi:type I restriction enzyme S subunit